MHFQPIWTHYWVRPAINMRHIAYSAYIHITMNSKLYTTRFKTKHTLPIFFCFWQINSPSICAGTRIGSLQR